MKKSKRIISTFVAAAMAITGLFTEKLPTADMFVVAADAADITTLPEGGLTEDRQSDTAYEVNGDYTLKLNGFSLGRDLDAASDEGYVIEVRSGTLTIEDTGNGKITGGKNSGTGGAVYVADGASLVLKSGSITGNTALFGGAVYVASGGSFVMNGGTISGNSSENDGGAVYVESDASFTMAGGTIGTAEEIAEDKNEAGGAGGGVFVDVNGEFVMKSGTIAGNTAADAAGGVYVSPRASFSIGENSTETLITVKGNKVSGKLSNVYLGSGQIVNIYGAAYIDEDSEVWLTSAARPSASNKVAVTNRFAGTGAFLKSDSEELIIEKKADATAAAYLAVHPDNFTKLRKLIENTGDGEKITLSADYKYDDMDASGDVGGIVVNEEKAITIDLNGHRIDRGLWDGVKGEAAENGYVIKNSGDLTIEDPTGKGVITGGNNAGDGGGINSTGTLTMTGGSVVGNRASSGGGIYASGDVEIGGTAAVSGNVAYSNKNAYGGGIYASGTVTIGENASVSDNTVYSGKNAYGGGIYLDSPKGELILEGAVADNAAGTEDMPKGFGGGIYAKSICTVTTDGGSVTGNTASDSYGGIYPGSTFNVEGQLNISGNKARSAESNVYIADTLGRSMTVTGEISGIVYFGLESVPYSDITVAENYGAYNVGDPSEVFRFEGEGEYFVKKIGDDVYLSAEEEYKELAADPRIVVIKDGVETEPTAVYAGDTLIAKSEASALTYKWYYYGAADSELGTEKSYIVTKDDRDKQIRVRVTQSKDADGNDKQPVTRTSGRTPAVQVIKPDAPEKVEATVSTDSITVTAPVGDGYEYSLDGNNWQSGVSFTGLRSSTQYTVYARTAETEYTDASDSVRANFTTEEVHVHEFTFKVKDNKLTATCTKPNCDIPDNKAILTITAEGGDYNKGKTYAAKLDLDEFNAATGLGARASVTYNGLNAAPSGAGTYIASANVVIGAKTYIISTEFTVAKVAPTVVKRIKAATGIKYDNCEHYLIEEGEYDGGTIYYRVGTDGSWGTTPKATLPGRYTIYYYVLGDPNHTDLGSAKEPFELEEQAYITGDIITDADVTVTLDSDVYDGKAKRLSVVVKVGNKTLVEGIDYTITVTNSSGNEVDEILNADIYTVTVTGRVKSTGGYAGTVTKTVTVSGSMITDRYGNPLTAAPRYGEILKATIIPEVETPVFQWVRIIGTTVIPISGATAQTYIINSADDIGANISVRVIYNGVTTLLAATLPAEKADNINGAFSQSFVSVTPATGAGNGDGYITINNYSINKPVEYSTDGGKTWNPATGGKITRLFNGMIVLIRYAGDSTHEAGEAASVNMPGALILIGASLSGNEVFGETLTVTPVPNGVGNFEYEWYRINGTEKIRLTAAVTDKYVLTKADIGCRIMAVIYDGTGSAHEAYTVGTIQKATYAAPVVYPTLVNTVTGGRITGLDATLRYEYSSDGGETWTEVPRGSVQITGLWVGTYLVRVRVDDPETTVALETEVTLTYEVVDQDAPTGLSPIYTTGASKHDGGIRGVTAEMEYSAGGAIWAAIKPDVSADGSLVLNGLGVGSYMVRYAAVKDGEELVKNASPTVTVTIKVKQDQAEPVGLTVEGATDKDAKDGRILGVTSDMEYSKDGGLTWTPVKVGETEISGLSSTDSVLVRLKGGDTVFEGEVLDLGIVGVINPLMTVRGVDYTGVYDGQPHTIMLTDIPEGATAAYSRNDILFAAAKPTLRDAGTLVVYWKLTDGKNVLIGSNTVTITPKGLSAAAEDQTITAGAKINDTAVTYSGAVGGDEPVISHGKVVIAGHESSDGSDLAPGTYALIISDPGETSDSNYSISTVTAGGRLTVLPASDSGKVYVTFMYGDGSDETVEIAKGSKVKKPADPKREGYSFGGWYTPEGAEWNFSTKVNSSLVLTAKWIPLVFSITYELNGGSFSTANEAPVSYTAADAVTLPKPVREGYSFAGWTGSGLDKATVEVKIPVGSTGDRTFTANWTAGRRSGYAVTVIGKVSGISDDLPKTDSCTEGILEANAAAAAAAVKAKPVSGKADGEIVTANEITVTVTGRTIDNAAARSAIEKAALSDLGTAVNTDLIEMTVLEEQNYYRVINGKERRTALAATAVEDTGSRYGITAAMRPFVWNAAGTGRVPVIYRYTDGRAERLTQLSARPLNGDFTDGTYYTEKLSVGKYLVFIYSRKSAVFGAAETQTASRTVSVTIGDRVYVGTVGQTIDAPETPVKSGYVFRRWEANDGSVITFPLTLTADMDGMVITPVFTPESGEDEYERDYIVRYIAEYNGRQLIDCVTPAKVNTVGSYGISANADFFSEAAVKLFGNSSDRSAIISYTITARSVYSNGTPYLPADGSDPAEELVVTIAADKFRDNASGTAYSLSVLYNDVCVYANFAAYSPDSGFTGVTMNTPSGVRYTGLQHRLAADPDALKPDSGKSASYDLQVSLIDRDNSYELVYGKDYTASYKNSVNASAEYTDSGRYYRTTTADSARPSVIIQGKGSYKGLKAVLYYDILPLSVSDSLQAVGSFADAVPGACAINAKGGITQSVVPSRYARTYNKNTGMYENTASGSTVKYALGKDVRAELLRWNASAGKWVNLGDITDKASQKAVFAGVNNEGQYSVRVTGIGNFCGSVTDDFYVAGSGSVPFSTLKVKTSAVTYSGSGVRAADLIKGITTKIGKATVSVSDITVTLEPVSPSAEVSADGTTVLSAGTFTAVIVPKNEKAFIAKYPGAVFDAPVTVTVTVKGLRLAAKMFTMDWSKNGEQYNGSSKAVTAVLSGISAGDVTIGVPERKNGRTVYVPLTDSELDEVVRVNGNKLTINGAFLSGGSVTDDNSEPGTYSIAFCGRKAYADSVYVYTFRRVGAVITSAMLRANDREYNADGVVTSVTVEAPDGRIYRLEGSDSDFELSYKNNKSVGTASVTVKVISDRTVFQKGCSASVNFKITPVQVDEILPYSEYKYRRDSEGRIYCRVDSTVQAGKKAPTVTLYQTPYLTASKLTKLNAKDYRATFTASEDGVYDLTITKGTAGTYDFGDGITISSAYVTYQISAKQWTEPVIAGTAALITACGSDIEFTSSDIDVLKSGPVPVTVSAKGKISVKYISGYYILPVISEITVEGHTLKFADGYYTITYKNNNKKGTAGMTLTLSQKAVAEFGIGGSTTFSFSITAS